MSRAEQALIERFAGAKIVKASALLGLAGLAPLLLYALLGPADGNPIGLGLLAAATTPIALVGMAVGAVKWLVERLAKRGG
jgi:hypothetical protein